MEKLLQVCLGKRVLALVIGLFLSRVASSRDGMGLDGDQGRRPELENE